MDERQRIHALVILLSSQHFGESLGKRAPSEQENANKYSISGHAEFHTRAPRQFAFVNPVSLFLRLVTSPGLPLGHSFVRLKLSRITKILASDIFLLSIFSNIIYSDFALYDTIFCKFSLSLLNRLY